jgi:hypothetical protein
MIWNWIYDDRRRKDPQTPGQSVPAQIAGEVTTGTKQGAIEMREATNEQEPSSTEGGEVKAGDRVWVSCKVIEPCENLIKVTGSGDDNWFWASRGQCRPEAEMIDGNELVSKHNKGIEVQGE